MEEEHSDQGLDHPFFSCLILILTIFSSAANATSFGPIPLVEQIEHSPYVIRGYVESRWVDMEKQSQRPYTYWKFRIEEQMQGPQGLSGEITIRQPGGEIGGLGYTVPSSADFSEGEHAVIMARTTNESGVLEVSGLASGKYTVVDTDNDGTEMRNGLGPTVTDATGKAIDLDQFRKVVERVKSRDTEAADLGIVVNRQGNDPHQHAFAAVLDPRDPRAGPKGTDGDSEPHSVNPSSSPQDKSVSNRQPASEKSSIGLSEDTWLTLFAIGSMLVAFLFAIIFFVRRKKHP